MRAWRESRYLHDDPRTADSHGPSGDHRAAVRLSDRAHDREAEPDPARGAISSGIDAMKAIEHALELVLGNAGAIVLDDEVQRVP